MSIDLQAFYTRLRTGDFASASRMLDEAGDPSTDSPLVAKLRWDSTIGSRLWMPMSVMAE
jgi:hypothetical protein